MVDDVLYLVDSLGCCRALFIMSWRSTVYYCQLALEDKCHPSPVENQNPIGFCNNEDGCKVVLYNPVKNIWGALNVGTYIIEILCWCP